MLIRQPFQLRPKRRHVFKNLRRLLILPQLLLCGLLVPRERMADLLEWISWGLPMTYAYDALARATADDLGARLVVSAAVVVGSVVVALALGATTLRRRTP